MIYDICDHSMLNPGLILKFKAHFDLSKFCILVNAVLTNVRTLGHHYTKHLQRFDWKMVYRVIKIT